MASKTAKADSHACNAPIAHIREADFEAEVLRSREPVLVAFLTPWSNACRVFSPILQDLASTGEGKVKVAEVNADDSLGLSLSYDIQSIPTLLYFVEGKLRLRIVGTATKEAILAKLGSSKIQTYEP
jgi:thioredoxin 1